LDQLFKYLIAAGVLDVWDRLYIFAAEDEGTALTDLITGALATTSGSPAFVVDRGYTGGTIIPVANFSPATAAHFMQDDASIFAWSNTSGNDGVSLIGSGGVALEPDNGGGYNYAVNSLNESLTDPDNGLGLYSASRTGAAVDAAYHNGILVGTGSNVSGAPSGSDFNLLNGTTRQICAAGIGSGLTAAQHLGLYTALRTYFTSIGVP
jgi:hypothetical protein